MPTSSYHDEPVPGIHRDWYCINRIAERLLERLCRGDDVVCHLEEALRRGLLRSMVWSNCEPRGIAPSEWADTFQLVWQDTSEGWLLDLAMRETGALLGMSCYIWKPDADQLWLAVPVGIVDTSPPEDKPTRSTSTNLKPAPDWLELVTPGLDDRVRIHGVFISRGSLRAAVQAELKQLKRKGPKDSRAYDRALDSYRPHWFVKAVA